MKKLDYQTPLIQCIILSSEDVVRTSDGFEDVNAGYPWGDNWADAFGNGN